MGGVAFTPDLALTIVSLAQSLTQAAMKRMLKDATLSLIPRKPLYDTAAEFSDCYQITCVEDENKHLSEAKEWKELSRVNSHWLGASSQKPKMFAQIGFHYLAIYPTPKASRNVTVTYVYETPTLVALSDAMTLPAEDLSFCTDLAEVVALTSTARGQKLTEATAKIKQFIQRSNQVADRVRGERDI
jgi:hypothetical protein